METLRKHTKLSAGVYQSLVKAGTELKPNPWALRRVRYHATDGVRRLELAFPELHSPSLVVPVSNIREFENASAKDLRELYLSPAGDTIISDRLDVHISVEGLIRDMAHSTSFNLVVSKILGLKGGRATSERKRVSSAENGKKGGRPPKVRTPAGIAG